MVSWFRFHDSFWSSEDVVSLPSAECALQFAYCLSAARKGETRGKFRAALEYFAKQFPFRVSKKRFRENLAAMQHNRLIRFEIVEEEISGSSKTKPILECSIVNWRKWQYEGQEQGETGDGSTRQNGKLSAQKQADSVQKNGHKTPPTRVRAGATETAAESTETESETTTEKTLRTAAAESRAEQDLVRGERSAAADSGSSECLVSLPDPLLDPTPLSLLNNASIKAPEERLDPELLLEELRAYKVNSLAAQHWVKTWPLEVRRQLDFIAPLPRSWFTNSPAAYLAWAIPEGAGPPGRKDASGETPANKPLTINERMALKKARPPELRSG